MAKKVKTRQLTVIQRNLVRLVTLMETTNEPYNLADLFQLAGSRASKKNLASEAHKTLKQPHVQAALTRARRKREKLVTMGPDEIISELEKIIRSYITDVVSWDTHQVKLIPSHQIPRDKLGAIKKVNIIEQEYTNKRGQKGTRRTITIQLHDRMKALGMLADIKNMRRRGGTEEAITSLAKAMHEAMTEKKQ